MPKLHEMLKNARIARHLSLAALAEMTGLGVVTIIKIEHARTIEPSFLKVVRLAQALELSLDALAGSEMRERVTRAQRRRLATRMRQTLKDNAEAVAAGRKAGGFQTHKTMKKMPKAYQEGVVKRRIEARWRE